MAGTTRVGIKTAPMPKKAEQKGAEGRQVGSHTLGKKIAEGGQGTVYHIEDSPYVAKVLEFDEFWQGVSAFLREITLQSYIAHPHVINQISHGEEDGLVYCILEHAGRDLGMVLNDEDKGKFDDPEYLRKTLKAIRDASKGVEYSHRMDILHLDIKPANVLVDDEGIGRIVDFGCAHYLGKNLDYLLDNTLSQRSARHAKYLPPEGAVNGTIGYLSFEQLCGVKNVNCRTDVFGLGVTLFHVLTGRLPYLGTQNEIIMHIKKKTVPSVSEVRKEKNFGALPEALGRLVDNCTKRDYAQRPRLANFIGQLGDVLDNL